MMIRDRSFGDHLRILFRVDRRRMTAALRQPTLSAVLAIVLPSAIVLSALWVLGTIGAPRAEDPTGAVALAMLISGPLAFLAYGVLFGGSDDGFLRQIGIDPRALYIERCSRLAALGTGSVVAVAFPIVSAGESLGRTVSVAVVAASSAVGIACLTLGWAARATVTSGNTWLGAGIRQFDPDLAKSAPLVYGPLLPFLGGVGLGSLAGTGIVDLWLLVAGSILVTVWLAHLGAKMFEGAAPRFVPHAREMTYAPPPQGEGTSFRSVGAATVLLPRRSSAVWVRDATVAARRFPWASRITWPVAILSFFGLARWGDLPGTRAWVLTAVGIALLLQGSAVVGLGGLERGHARWIDRSAALGWWERFMGRWAWAWGLSLWLLVPVAFAWNWWSDEPGAWAFPLAGAAAAAAAAAVSLLRAESPR